MAESEKGKVELPGDDDVELELPPANLLPEGVMSEIDMTPEGLCIKYTNVPASGSVQVAVYALLAMQSLRRVFQDELVAEEEEDAEEAREAAPEASDPDAGDEDDDTDAGEEEEEEETTGIRATVNLPPTPASPLSAAAAQAVSALGGGGAAASRDRRTIRISRRHLLSQEAERRQIGFKAD